MLCIRSAAQLLRIGAIRCIFFIFLNSEAQGVGKVFCEALYFWNFAISKYEKNSYLTVYFAAHWGGEWCP